MLRWRSSKNRLLSSRFEPATWGKGGRGLLGCDKKDILSVTILRLDCYGGVWGDQISGLRWVGHASEGNKYGVYRGWVSLWGKQQGHLGRGSFSLDCVNTNVIMSRNHLVHVLLNRLHTGAARPSYSTWWSLVTTLVTTVVTARACIKQHASSQPNRTIPFLLAFFPSTPNTPLPQEQRALQACRVPKNNVIWP